MFVRARYASMSIISDSTVKTTINVLIWLLSTQDVQINFIVQTGVKPGYICFSNELFIFCYRYRGRSTTIAWLHGQR